MQRIFLTLFAVAALATGAEAQQKPARTAVASKPAPPVSVAPAKVEAPAPQTKGITNEDVVQMVQGGLGESVVVAAIRNAKATDFDVTPMALLALKKAGVSDAIVALMIDPKAPPSAATNAGPVFVNPFPGGSATDGRARIDSATASPEIAREAGIYWDRGRDGAHNLVVLEPNVFSQGKTGGMFTSALTYGLKKVNWKAIVRGSAANFKIEELEPTFYFYFESKGAGLGNTGGFTGWLSGATSPNEFVLARMTSKSKERELVVGEMGAFGGSSGTRSKDTIDIAIERLSGGIYRVKAAKPLEPGEYCFFYAGGVSTLGLGTSGGGKLFDFGIYAGK